MTESITTPWRFAWLLAAPHRLGFFAAALMMSTSALWWGAVLFSQALGQAPPFAVAPTLAHALLMALGFTPLFITGFLFTAGPKWLGLGEVGARSLLPAVAAMLLGWLLALLGFHWHTLLASAGVGLVTAGWMRLCLKFIALLRQSRMDDRVHATVVAIACSIGAVAMLLAAVALAMESVTLLRSATLIALWGFVAPVFVAVSHRMIPFFSASAVPMLDAWRPMWLLWVMLATLLVEGLPAVAELWWWPLPAGLRWLQVALEAPAALLLLWLTLRWGLVQSLRIRLLAMLHGGFMWLGVAIALSAGSHALGLLTNGELSLGLAPLHAMTMGYLGATLFAMATRVSSGHGGRPLAADNPAWALYWVLQSAVLLRVGAAIWPALATPLTLLAISAWSVATVGWAIRYGAWFGRPRVDGRPG
jgi:uncharacterized protein involved in response to NO